MNSLANRIIWCTPGRSDEAAWIAAVAGRGFTVVRRCVEATDVLAAASIENQAAVIIDLATPRLSMEILDAISSVPDRVIVGVVDNDDDRSRANLAGITAVVRSDSENLVDDVLAELRSSARGEQVEHNAGSRSPDRSPVSDQANAATPATSITVVYGAVGAPGRSTVALGMAEAWARTGDRVCVIDADTIGPSLALLVGMNDDVSGLLVASRYADQGALDVRSLGSACRRLGDRLYLMSGIGSPDRWHHLRPSTWERVLAACAEHFDRVVIDTNPLLDLTEDSLPSGPAQRDSAARSALQMSTSVVAVTQPDAVSLLRLVSDLVDLRSVVHHSNITVAVNRLPRRADSNIARVREVLCESGLNLPVHAIPEDRSLLTCRQTGSLLSEVPATRKVRRSLAKIADAVAA